MVLMNVLHWIQCSRCFGFILCVYVWHVYCHNMLEVHYLLNGKNCSICLHSQFCYKQFINRLPGTSLHCTLYSMKNDARFFCSCINSIIFLKNTCLRGIFEIDFISIDKLWVSDEERVMRMFLGFFYEMFVVHVPIKFILITASW